MAEKDLQCKYCDTEMKETIYGNYSVRCPYCYRLLKHISDNGFGPVTPFHICVGSEVVGVVESKFNNYILKFQGREIKLKKTYFDAVHEAEEYVVNTLGVQIPTVEFPLFISRASLFFYGEAFEEPYENDHKIQSVHFDGELLVITFKNWEELFVYHPKDIVSTEKELRIGSAAKVKWSHILRDRVGSKITNIYQCRDDKIWRKNNHGECMITGSESEPAVLLEKW